MGDAVCVLELGMRVQHRATGFKGTVTGKATYLERTPEFMVQGVDKNGLPVERWWQSKELIALQKEED